MFTCRPIIPAVAYPGALPKSLCHCFVQHLQSSSKQGEQVVTPAMNMLSAHSFVLTAGVLMNGKHNECRLQTLRHQVCADGKLYCKHGAFGCLEFVGADALHILLPTMCSVMLCAALSQTSESIWLNVTCCESVLSACWFMPTRSRSTCL